MADFGIFIGFGFPIPGRDEAAVKVFNELLQLLGQQAQAGNVESIEPAILQPHGGELGGFIIARGERTKLDALVASDAFQRLTVRAQSCVSHFGVVNATMGAELQRSMSTFLSDTADLR